MLALITTQQLGMQVHKAPLASRKLFLEGFDRTWVCCAAEHGMSVLQEEKSTINAVFLPNNCNMSLWKDLFSNLANPRGQYMSRQTEWLTVILSWWADTDPIFCAGIHSIPAKWEGYLGAGSLRLEKSLMGNLVVQLVVAGLQKLPARVTPAVHRYSDPAQLDRRDSVSL